MKKIFLLGILAAKIGLSAQLSQIVWTCVVPCLTDESTPKILKSVKVAWCGTVAQTHSMIDTFTPACRETNGNPNAHAVLFSKEEGLYAQCITSSKACPVEGPVKVGFSCSVLCSGQPSAVKFGVCAGSNVDAWAAATQVCPNPVKPQMHGGEIAVCEATGQTPCN